MRKKRWAAGLLAAALLAGSAAAQTLPAGRADYEGVDIYHGTSENGQIDWALLRQSRQFVYIKADEGEHTADPMFAQNHTAAAAAGMRWGPYHFLRLYSAASAQKQADAYWARIKGLDWTLLPAVDVESHDGQRTAAGMRACVRAFVDEFARTAGFKPVLYTDTSYANDYLRGQFADCGLWLADYRGYAGDVMGWTSYDAWQYSEHGRLAAIRNDEADLDVATAQIFAAAPGTAGQTSSSTAAEKQADPAFGAAWPGYQAFGWGQRNDWILKLDRALIRAGYARYYRYGASGASRSWGAGTQRACAAFQRAQGWTGLGADGVPGPETWRRLSRYF